MKTPVYQELEWRGFIKQKTSPDIEGLLAQSPLKVYVGFDPTGASLHIGSLVTIMGLSHLQRAGHTPVILMGGATGMIGDPSGKTEERRLQTLETIRENMDGVRGQLRRFFSFAGPNAAVMVNNLDWTAKFSYLEFLREVGKHITVKDMLEKDSAKRRLEREQSISYTEFSYMILQAHDFLHLHDELGCRLQAGGDDQWGNITLGIDLIRKLRSKEAYGLTFPLLTTASGEKFGKTEKGTSVWLDAKLTTPYRFYQYFVNVDDKDVVGHLKLFTYLSREEIAALAEATAKTPEQRQAQKRLAHEVTALVHGAAAAESVAKASEVVFSEAVRDIPEDVFREVFADVTTAAFPAADLAAGLAPVDALVKAGLAKSRGEARRLVEQGGVYLNNRKAGLEAKITAEGLLFGRWLLLRKGRKETCLLKFE
ncbi:MAG: tyrosine--tRNA ligase [Elusimicrobia bacterium]|nr:tyrosine--tRNA ligase [Elusimicrobiota bacterium]